MAESLLRLELSIQFEMIYELHHFVGLEVEKAKDRTLFSQKSYANELSKKLNLNRSKSPLHHCCKH